VPFDKSDLMPQIASTPADRRSSGPFDYGRFEFRVDLDTGDVNFLEVNLQANLWSQKVYRPLGGAGRLEPVPAHRDDPLREPRRHGLRRTFVKAAPRGRISPPSSSPPSAAGKLDPLADRAGATHKCLVPIVGKPLLEYVLAPFRGAGPQPHPHLGRGGRRGLARTAGAKGEFGVRSSSSPPRRASDSV
jgi:hypothetical protein